MFRLNLFRAFLYPLTAPRRLLLAWLILPLSLLVLVPPILVGLGLGGALTLNWQQGLGLSLGVVATCVAVGSVPFTALAGYLYRCRQRVMEGENVLPPWAGWRRLFIDGSKMDTLGLILILPSAILLTGGVISVVGPLSNLGSHRDPGSLLLALVGSGTGLMLLLTALLCWLFVLLISPMASLRLARGASPLEALYLEKLFSDIRLGWPDYLLCCLVCWGISLAFQAAQAAFLPLIIVSFPAQVYLQLVWSNLLGQYARAYRLGDPSQ